MGRAEKAATISGAVVLWPEEALYLVERGNLDLRWGGQGEDGGKEGEGEDGGKEGEEGGLVMSLQAAYAVLVGELGLTVERFSVYAGLRRSGYIVQRGPAWYDEDYEKIVDVERRVGNPPERLGLFAWLFQVLWRSKPADPPPRGPLLGPGLYRSYSLSFFILLESIDLTDFSPLLKSKKVIYTASSPLSQLTIQLYGPLGNRLPVTKIYCKNHQEPPLQNLSCALIFTSGSRKPHSKSHLLDFLISGS